MPWGPGFIDNDLPAVFVVGYHTGKFSRKITEELIAQLLLVAVHNQHWKKHQKDFLRPRKFLAVFLLVCYKCSRLHSEESC